MKVVIHADDVSRGFTVELEHEGRCVGADVSRDDGTWRIQGSGIERFLAPRRIEWPEAIRRALVALQEEMGK
jgi:hypothetical protein